MKPILISIAALILTGCAAGGSLTPDQKMTLLSMDRQTLDISCTGPCSVRYTDPRDQIQIPKETNAYDVMSTALGAGERLLGRAIPYAAGVEAIRTVAPLLGDRDSNNTYPTQVVRPEVVQTPAPEVVQLPAPEVIIIDNNQAPQ